MVHVHPEAYRSKKEFLGRPNSSEIRLPCIILTTCSIHDPAPRASVNNTRSLGYQAKGSHRLTTVYKRVSRSSSCVSRAESHAQSTRPWLQSAITCDSRDSPEGVQTPFRVVDFLWFLSRNLSNGWPHLCPTVGVCHALRTIPRCLQSVCCMETYTGSDFSYTISSPQSGGHSFARLTLGQAWRRNSEPIFLLVPLPAGPKAALTRYGHGIVTHGTGRLCLNIKLIILSCPMCFHKQRNHPTSPCPSIPTTLLLLLQSPPWHLRP